MPKRFVLLDRDGTVIKEKNYLSDPDEVELIPGAAAALKRLQNEGWGICLVTNQSGIARGYFDIHQLRRVHQRLADELALFDVQLDGIYICPHCPEDGCNCRKPSPGLINQAMAVHGFNPRQAWVVGDREVDVGLGHAVGAKSVLVRTGYGKSHEAETLADLVADDLSEAVDGILHPIHHGAGRLH
jgi:D-glycero-D-manno-heptose 1,7-bisphosphate phosphatase